MLGSRGSGALGNNAANNSLVPQLVSNLVDAVELAVGIDHSCALRADGSVACWGSNDVGQIGATTVDVMVTSPTMVTGLPPVVHVASAAYATCAATAGGEVWCWGGNDEGTLGDGTRTSRLSPAMVIDLCP